MSTDTPTLVVSDVENATKPDEQNVEKINESEVPEGKSEIT